MVLSLALFTFSGWLESLRREYAQEFAGVPSSASSEFQTIIVTELPPYMSVLACVSHRARDPPERN